MQQRYYDPVAARFLSVDPVVSDETGKQFGRYVYVNNSPYSRVDPDGRFAIAIPVIEAAATWVASNATATVVTTAAVAGVAAGVASNAADSNSSSVSSGQSAAPAPGKAAGAPAGAPPPEDDKNKSRGEKRQEKINEILDKNKLPRQGEVTFEPQKKWNPSEPLPRGEKNGFMDKFGREWVKGPSRTAGQHFEWDVQLNDGTGRHLNVSWDGVITH